MHDASLEDCLVKYEKLERRKVIVQRQSLALPFFLEFKMEFMEALFIFIAGAVAHAGLSRLMGVYSRVKIARVALINCLGILTFTGRHAQNFLEATCEDEISRPYISGAVKYWQKLSVLSLRNSVPLSVWQSLGIKDWEDVERLIKKIEQAGEQNEKQT